MNVDEYSDHQGWLSYWDHLSLGALHGLSGPYDETNPKYVNEELPISRLIPCCDTLLDAGCGPGRYIPLLQDKAKVYVAADYSIKMLEEAQKLHGHYKQVIFVKADLAKFPILNKFDVVLLVAVLRHLPMKKAEKVLNRMVTVTKGTLFFTATIFPEEDSIPYDLYGETIKIIDHPFHLSQIEQWISPYKAEMVEIQDRQPSGCRFGKFIIRPKRPEELGFQVPPELKSIMIIPRFADNIPERYKSRLPTRPMPFHEVAKLFNDMGLTFEHKFARRYVFVVRKS